MNLKCKKVSKSSKLKIFPRGSNKAPRIMLAPLVSLQDSMVFLLDWKKFKKLYHKGENIKKDKMIKEKYTSFRNGWFNTWPDAANASVRRETANHTCIHIWCAAIATGPCRAAIDVPNVMVERTESVLPRRKPPVTAHRS